MTSTPFEAMAESVRFRQLSLDISAMPRGESKARRAAERIVTAAVHDGRGEVMLAANWLRACVVGLDETIKASAQALAVLASYQHDLAETTMADARRVAEAEIGRKREVVEMVLISLVHQLGHTATNQMTSAIDALDAALSTKTLHAISV